MKKIIGIALVVLFYTTAGAQELYVNTEPASNMAAGSIGFRLLSKWYRMDYNNSFSGYRIEPELMLGATRRLMVHVAGYGSNMYQKKFHVEGGSLYAKYRLYSQDDVHEHFRIAAYTKIALIDNPQQLQVEGKKNVPDGNGGFIEQSYTTYYKNNEFDIDGNNSGIAGGFIATKLVNKLAVSTSLSYGYRLNNLNDDVLPGQPLHSVNYSASAGYLLLPAQYASYNQTNVNLYIEIIGSTFPGKKTSYADIAPAMQFIIKSIARVDLSYRTQLAGNTPRLSTGYFLVRFEYNLLNIF